MTLCHILLCLEGLVYIYIYIYIYIWVNVEVNPTIWRNFYIFFIYIISGINTTPHKIAKYLTKILTSLLGIISPSHFKKKKKTGNLLNKIRCINMENKLLASFDIQSLYTNLLVKKCISQLKTHLEKNQFSPLSPNSPK